jgi:hypothetical protein
MGHGSVIDQLLSLSLAIPSIQGIFLSGIWPTFKKQFRGGVV